MAVSRLNRASYHHTRPNKKVQGRPLGHVLTFDLTSSNTTAALIWSSPGSTPHSLKQILPLALNAPSMPSMSLEMYDVDAKCLFFLTASSATGVCIVHGTSETTMSVAPTSSSSLALCSGLPTSTATAVQLGRPYRWCDHADRVGVS